MITLEQCLSAAYHNLSEAMDLVEPGSTQAQDIRQAIEVIQTVERTDTSE